MNKNKAIRTVLDDIAREWNSIDRQIKAIDMGNNSPGTYAALLLRAQALRALASKLQSAVRAKERPERRAMCAHERRRYFRDGSARCTCGMRYERGDGLAGEHRTPRGTGVVEHPIMG